MGVTKPMPMKNTPQERPVVSYRKEMQQIRECFGHLTIEEYIGRHLMAERNSKPISEAAYDSFQKNFKKEVRLVSTAGHLGLIEWDFPILLSENILSNILYAMGKSGVSVPILPFGRIPFSNDSKPGAIVMQDQTRGGFGKYVFRGTSHVTVDRGAAITRQEADSFANLMRIKLERHPQREAYSARINLLVSRIQEMISASSTFKGQAEWLSEILWPYLFEDAIARAVKPPVFRAEESLDIESDNLLENPKARAKMEELFKGVWGAYDGTYFYYGSCKCGREFPLTKEENGQNTYLSGNCVKADCGFYGSEKYVVSVADIPEALKRGELHETLLMTFYKVWALAGINVMGGFNQVEYLAELKQKLVRLFDAIGEQKKAAILSTRPTDLFNTGLVLAFNPDGSPKHGSQVFLEGGLSKEHLDTILSLNFGKILDASNYFMNASINSERIDKARFRQIIDLYGLSSIVY